MPSTTMRLAPRISTLLYAGLFTTLNVQFFLQRLLHQWYEPSISEAVATLTQTGPSPTNADVKPHEFPESAFDASEHVAACLIVMDDNHFLIEWIAYHYHVANLRHLIITSDPNSMTKPSKVLDRWRDRMIIDEWDSGDFLPLNFEKVVKKLATNGLRQKNVDLQNHRTRQAMFNIECLRDMQELNRTWVMMTDTDEYLVPNPVLETKQADDNSSSIERDDGDNDADNDSNEDEGEQKNSASPKNLIKAHRPGKQGSVAAILNSLTIPNEQFPKLDSPCIPLHRRQFTTREDQHAMDIESPIDYHHFQTLRWRRYGQHSEEYRPENFDVTCKRHVRVPNKVIINVKFADLWDEDNEGNPHRPLSVCTSEVYLRAEQTPLIVNHYMGTKEQWLYRVGDKRGLGFRLARFYDLNVRSGHYVSEDISSWLTQFVKDIGEDTALRLLEGVGELEPIPEHYSAHFKTEFVKEKQEQKGQRHLIAAEGESVGLDVDEPFKRGELVQSNYHGDGYWFFAEVVDILPGGHYNLIYDDCTQDLAAPEHLIRRHGRATVGMED